MTKILLGAHMSIAGGFYKAALAGEDVGCSAIQIFTKSNRQWKAKEISAEDIKMFHEYLSRCNIHHVVAHASYLINICSPNKETQTKSINALITELDRCHQLGIQNLVLHPGSKKDQDEKQTLKQAANILDFVLSKTPKSTNILLETMAGQGSAVGYTFEQISSIISMAQDSSRIGVCLDTCHIFAAGYKFSRELEYKEMWDHFDKTIGLQRLKLIHLNDSKKENNSRVDRHDHIGKGKIGIEAFRLIMNDEKLIGIPKILETPKEADLAEDKKSIETLVKTITPKNLESLKNTNLEKYL